MTSQANFVASSLTAPPGAKAQFAVDGEPVNPVFVDPAAPWKEIASSPGWRKCNGRFAPQDAGADPPLSSSVVAFEAMQFVPTGLLLVDFYNTDASASSEPHSVAIVGVEPFMVYPGAGYSVTLGGAAIQPVGYPPNGADKNPAGGFYPDVIYSGQTGSPRNRFVPAYWNLIGVPPGTAVNEWVHAYRYSALQIQRPNERVNEVGEINEGAWVDPGKAWPKRALFVGNEQKVLDGYSTNHVALQELAAIYLAGKDPRSYRRLKALAIAFLKWDWYCGEPIRSKIPYSDNSRMKGRALEACAWAYRCAEEAEDLEFSSWVVDRASAHIAAIISLWGANPTPSRTAADGRHLLEPWDATWCVALIGWGASLCASFIGASIAADLAHRVCDWQEEMYARGLGMGRKGCPKDIPAIDGDLSRATWFLHKDENPPPTDDRFGLATSQWIPAAFDLMGRSDAKLVKDLRAAALSYSSKYVIANTRLVLP